MTYPFLSAAEVGSTSEECKFLTADNERLRAENERLRAEIERLRAAPPKRG